MNSVQRAVDGLKITLITNLTPINDRELDWHYTSMSVNA